MGPMKKKGEAGEAVQYITRNQAVKRLQVNLKDFRRLCILKGIYPREPKNRRKVQKGSSEIKTLFYRKDIRFLMHEPIIWKFREMKIYSRRLKKAYNKVELDKARAMKEYKPTYRLDHIVRERYPTFVDALNDLEDPLTLCSLFAVLPKNGRISTDMTGLCRRLTVEFMHYVIEARALRKVFISIKGYYYQVEILGQTITWIIPHPFSPETPPTVDFRIMGTFCEFYMTVLGFVNFRLFHKLNLRYPPKVLGNAPDTEEGSTHYSFISERVASLSTPLQRNTVEDDKEDEVIDTSLFETDDIRLEEARKADEERKNVQQLFQGLRFFLSRENNRESLTFVIRSCGGEVSWDASCGEGFSYLETDETITHHIVDRPNMEMKYLSRFYVQPQWAYDCVNGRLLLPVQDYLPGVELPAHLSPFAVETNLTYIPPEKERLLALQRGEELPHEERKEDAEEEESEEDDSDEDDPEGKEFENDMLEEVPEESDNEETEEEESTEEVKAAKEKMAVLPGKPRRVNEEFMQRMTAKEERKMRVMMIPKKSRRLYRKLKDREDRIEKQARMYSRRRKSIEEEKKGTNKDNEKTGRNKEQIGVKKDEKKGNKEDDRNYNKKEDKKQIKKKTVDV